MALWLAPASVAAPADAPRAEQAAQDQVLTWTASNSISEYGSAPKTATAGTATIVFVNNESTGNTMGMSHTLTFSTTRAGYNQDVDVDILANPFDSNGGRHEVQVTLSPGKYYYYCKINGHTMKGVLTVTDDGGGGGDTTAPQVSAGLTGERDADGDYVGSATVTVSASDSGSGVESIEYEVDDTGFRPYSGPVTVSDPGDHTVQYRATDSAGNVSEVGSVAFTVVEPQPADTIAPDVSASVTGDKNADGAYVGSATVTVSASDTESGVATVESRLDGGAWTTYSEPLTVNESGAHTVSYRATDEAGNMSEPESVSFTVAEPQPADTTAPETSADVAGKRDAAGAYVGSATVTVSAQDAGSGVATVEYSLDGAPYAAYTGPVEVDQPGDHTVAYRATDNAGNTSEPRSVSFTVVEPAPEDTTAPDVSASVTGDQDAAGAYVGSATVTVSATDTESDVATVEFRLDGGAWTTYSEPLTVNNPGAHTVDYRATDNAGNMAEPESVSFTVAEPQPEDTTAPEVAVSVSGEQNADGDYLDSATTTLTAQDDGSGVAGIEYAVDGSPYASYTGPVEVNQPGEHTISYRATDEAGNVSEPESVTFTVVESAPEDTTAPNVSASVSGDRNAAGAYVGSATVTVSASDTESGVDTVQYRLDGGAWTDYSLPLSVNDPGEHTVEYRATDQAGNTANPPSVSFKIVSDASDACPDSDTRASVIIDGEDTGVANVDTGNGCTINDLINAAGAYNNHGAFVKHVDRVTDRLNDDGVITGKEKGRIMRAAGRSDIGK